MSPDAQKQLQILSDILGQSQPTNLSDFARAAQPPQNTFAQFLAALSSPPAPPVIQDRWFRGQTIYIDGYTFERCRFDACTLVMGNATFAFRQCFIAETCRLFFSGPSLKVARLLLHTMRIQGRIQTLAGEEGVFAAMGADGTFTVE